jgi:maltokinase
MSGEGLVDHLLAALPGFLVRQRWYARPEGAREGDLPRITLVDHQELAKGPPRLTWLVVEAEGGTYQVLVGTRPEVEAAEIVGGNDDAVVGPVEAPTGRVLGYEATLDPDLNRVLLQVASDGRVHSGRVRPVGAEQSNTSLVYDDKIIVKFFRRLRPGPNPDVEVSLALDEVGFNHIPAPLVVWRRGDWDLAFVQQYLAGGTEGWTLALTSLRDLYAAAVGARGPEVPAGPAAAPERAEVELPRPETAGGDFGSESSRIGAVTARMHLALAEAFGSGAGDVAEWAGAIESELDGVSPAGLSLDAARAVTERLRGVEAPGASIRVHGDFHLGQVMRTDVGWYVLDFEGEPARTLEERSRHVSPLKDVAGMLRSLQYAAAVGLDERDPAEQDPGLWELGKAWEWHNREAFLQGYLATPGIDALVPADPPAFDAVLAAFELQKAVYELAYELAYRPGWVHIPRAALERLLAG